MAKRLTTFIFQAGHRFQRNKGRIELATIFRVKWIIFECGI
jgi:hypothetical protein